MATVLLIDDDEELTRLVGAYLVREGFEVAMAPDGTKALWPHHRNPRRHRGA